MVHGVRIHGDHAVQHLHAWPNSREAGQAHMCYQFVYALQSRSTAFLRVRRLVWAFNAS